MKHQKEMLTKQTVVYDTYWYFAAERQNVFFKRLEGEKRPWTEDQILEEYRFTNAYRAADRVSQYLIKNVIYAGDPSAKEVFFRIILFKLFNKIETWELLCKRFGEVCWTGYSFKHYNNVLEEAICNQSIYTAAYIMPSGKKAFGHIRKHANHLRLLERMMEDSLPRRISDAGCMEDVFYLLRTYPMIGDFLAYQYVIDINYSELTDFSEMQFVIPGPGARAGIRKCFEDFGRLSESDIIRYVAENQQEEFAKRELKFRTLWGRPLQLIDCQNLFCEVDKYSRVAHPELKYKDSRTRIKQKYLPNNQHIEYWFPPKWGLNDLVT